MIPIIALVVGFFIGWRRAARNGVRIARKHVGWYFEDLGLSRETRRAFNALESTQAQLDFVDALAAAPWERAA